MWMKDVDALEENLQEEESDDSLAFRDFTVKYSFILVNEHYDKLKEFCRKHKLKATQDIPYVKDDAINVRTLVSLIDIPQENVVELFD